MGIGRTKKRKIHADFKTVKHKLGKKIKSSTRTDLSFKTLTISVSQQSVAAEKEQFVTHRHLSLGDLLRQLKHHNHSTRRDAVVGLKTLLTTWPFLLEENAAKIFEHLVEMVLDGNSSVRAALRVLLKSLFGLSKSALTPFFPVFVAYISVAMTHVDYAIQSDAILFVDVWLQEFPDLVSQHAHKLLPHYLMLLKVQDLDDHGTMTGALLPNSGFDRINGGKEGRALERPFYLRVTLLASLHNILAQLVSLRESSQGESKKSNRAGYSEAREPLTANWMDCSGVVQLTRPLVEKKYSFSSFLEATGVLTSFEKTCIEYTNVQTPDQFPDENRLHLKSVESFRYFFVLLFPLLVFTWLESNPRHLTVQNIGHAVNAVGILNLLLAQLERFADAGQEGGPLVLSEDKDKIVRYIVNEFPMECISSGQMSAGNRMELVKLNVGIAKIGSYFYRDGEGDLDKLVGFVIRILNQIFLEEVGLEDRKKLRETYFEVTSDILHVLKKLLVVVDLETSMKLLEAFQRFGEACPLKSRARRASVEFVGELLCDGMISHQSVARSGELEEHNRSKFPIDSFGRTGESDRIESNKTMHSAKEKKTRTPTKLIGSLIVYLTKTLWELKNSSPNFSHEILKKLRNYNAQISDAPNSVYSQILQKAISPLFWTKIDKRQCRGAEAKPDKLVKEVCGPFLSLPSRVQRTAIEVLYYFKNLSPALIQGLVHCTSVSKSSFEIVQYTLETLDFVRHFDGSIADYLSFLLSVLANCHFTANSSDSNLNTRRRKLFELAHLVAYLAYQLNLQGELFGLVDTHLLEILMQSDSPDLVRVVSAFIGFYLKLIKPSSVLPPTSESPSINPSEDGSMGHSHLPSPLKDELPKRLFSFLSSTFPETTLHRLPSDIVYAKELFSNDCFLFQSFLQHWRDSTRTCSEFDLALLSDFFIKYPLELSDSLQRSEEKIRFILALLKQSEQACSVSNLESEINAFYST